MLWHIKANSPHEISDAAIAQMAGVTSAAVSAWKRGIKPRHDTIVKLAEGLAQWFPGIGIDAVDLMRAAGHKDIPPKQRPVRLPPGIDLAAVPEHEELIWRLPLPMAERKALVAFQQAWRKLHP